MKAKASKKAAVAVDSKTRGAKKSLKAKPAEEMDYPRPFPVPDWLEKNPRIVFMNNLGGNGVDTALEVGVNIHLDATNAADIHFAGGPYILDSKDRIYNLWSGETIDLEPIRKNVDEAHAKGIRVFGELFRKWNPRVLYLDHPEWQEMPFPNGKPKGPEMIREFPSVTGCWNSPFGDHFIKQCVKLAKELDWDGYSLDGFGCWTTCYCPACRKAYKDETGLEIPYRETPDGPQPFSGVDGLEHPGFTKYVKWRMRRYSRFVYKWQKALKDMKSDFVAMPWSSGPGRWFIWTFAPNSEGSDHSNRLVDAPILELFWDFPPDQGNNLLPSFTVRYYRGLSGERPVFMLPYRCTQGQQNMVAPQVECDFRILTVITNGAKPVESAHQLPNENHKEALKHFVDLMKQYEGFTYKAKSVKWAAMLISESSRLFHGIPGSSVIEAGAWIASGVDTNRDLSQIPAGDRRLPTHFESALGVFRACMEEHLPLDIITEADIEQEDKLSHYRVLVLANAACLSDVALEKIKAFSDAGNGVVAMHESSLYDEHGVKREDFGLKDLFKASFQGIENNTAWWPNYPNSTNISFAKHEITTDPVVQGNPRNGYSCYDYIGVSTVVKGAAGARMIANRGARPQPPDEAFLGQYFFENGENQWAWKDATPFILTNNEGTGGRTVYFAGDMGQSYFISPYQYERKLIANSLRWATGSVKPPVSVKAPMCVQMTCYEQAHEKRVIVHLLNEINTTADRAWPDNNSSMREEVLPIHDIEVLLRGMDLKRVWLEPMHKELRMKKTAEGIVVTVPKLELHAMVVGERK